MQSVRVLQCVVCMTRAGTETLLMNLYRQIDREKIQFDFLTSFEGDYDKEIAALGGRVWHIPFITQCGPFAYARALRQFFAGHPEYRIVHSHMDKFSGMVLREAQKAGVPVRIAHSHSIRSDGGLAYKLVKGYYGTMVNRFRTDGLACSEAAARWMFGRRAGDVAVLKNGIDPERFPFAPVPHEGFVIIHVGNFLPVKNYGFLLDVFEQVQKADPAARLVLAGDGLLRPKVEAAVRRRGLSQRVTFTGACRDVQAELNRADVFCLPSRFEGLGIVLVEAQSCGVPCVVSDRVPPDANVTGRLCYLPLGDAGRWAGELLRTRGAQKWDGHAAIREKGYDIRESAAFLQQYYLEHAEKLS